MALTTQAQIQAALPGQTIPWQKSIGGGNTVAAGSIASDWKNATVPPAGANPSTGAGDAPTSTTTGAPAFVNAPGGKSLYLARIPAASHATRIAPIMFYDRLVETSGLDGTLTTSQTVNTGAITRGDTNGVGVEAFLEVYTALGATPTTATVNYTDSDGTAQTCSIAIPATAPAGLLLPFTCANGEIGIKSVQSVTFAASTGAAGNFGVTLARKITGWQPVTAAGGVVAGQHRHLSWRVLGLPKIENGACIWQTTGPLAIAGSIGPGVSSFNLITV